MTFVSRLAAVTLAALACGTMPGSAQQGPPPAQQYSQPPPGQQYPPQPSQQYQPEPGQQYAPPPGQQYSQQPPANLPPPHREPGPEFYGPDELVTAGQRFFGNVSRGLASIIERAVSQWGLPNGYVLGEEGSGAFVAGLRYGEGTLYTKNAGDLPLFPEYEAKKPVQNQAVTRINKVNAIVPS